MTDSRPSPTQETCQCQPITLGPVASTSRTTLEYFKAIDSAKCDENRPPKSSTSPSFLHLHLGQSSPTFDVNRASLPSSTSNPHGSKGKQKAVVDLDTDELELDAKTIAMMPTMTVAILVPSIESTEGSEASHESYTSRDYRQFHSAALSAGTVRFNVAAAAPGTTSTITSTRRIDGTVPQHQNLPSLSSPSITSLVPILDDGVLPTPLSDVPSATSDRDGFDLSATSSGVPTAEGGNTSANGTGSFWATTSWKLRSGKMTMDRKRLQTLGFDEELTRDFDFWASFGLTICNIGGFPGTVLAVLTAMRTGGSSMYAFAWPISGLFMMALAAVLGEMASTWPVAGAMFTWTFRLCRSSRRLDPWARYFSWIVGSFLLCSHILVQIIITWQFAHNLLGVIGLYTKTDDSVWVSVGICWAVLLGSALIVSSPLVRSPWFWRGCGLLTIIFFLTLNITLLTSAKTIKSAKWVFSNYENDTGFTSKAYVYMLGWVLTCVASGMEAAAHIAEDTRAPSRTVPLAMFWSVAATYAMGWFSICVLLATLDASSLDPTLLPSIALLANSIPRAHTTVVLVFVLFSFAFQSVAQLLATSRFTWALARESALPFSDLLRRISPSKRLPLSAIWVVVAISFPAMLLILVDASILGTIFLEAGALSVILCYAVPILIYLFLPSDALAGDGRAQWTLRGWSKPLAVAGVLFATIAMIMLCLPTASPVNAASASYASAVFLIILLLASLAWVFYGNAHYAGPIKTTTRWTIGAEIELPRSATTHKSSVVNGGVGGGGGGMKLEQAKAAGIVDSEILGRSAHVFSSFPTRGTTTGGGDDRGGGAGSGGTESGFELSRGQSSRSDWSTDWDGEDEEEYSSDEDRHGEATGQTTTEHSVGTRRSRGARWRSRRDQETEGPRTPDEHV